MIALSADAPNGQPCNFPKIYLTPVVLKQRTSKDMQILDVGANSKCNFSSLI